MGLLLGVVGLRRYLHRSPDRWERAGTVVMAAGFVLLLPGSVVPGGWYPSALASAVPLVFFAGLAWVDLGVAVARTGQAYPSAPPPESHA